MMVVWHPRVFSMLVALGLLMFHLAAGEAEQPRSFSGIFPHLAMFNGSGECGTGAVVPWADQLWVVTYAPHMPKGSDDNLYAIASDLSRITRPESIGGTPANRMIHPESQQLFIGPYVVDRYGDVRTIPYTRMFGRPTGNARHLLNPSGAVYCASMEEALYEIDVETLAVQELFADEAAPTGRHAELPGYHGKGMSSGYGVVIYGNNGEHGDAAKERPEIASGVLAEWDGRSSNWHIVARNQFTEVTTPDGIYGNLHPETNPIWAMGWDHRSLILMCRDQRGWHRFRLSKPSHSYDGAHGWNTEWPRIREIGEDQLLMTMHGAFWAFPREFQSGRTGGIRPRSSYLKVVGDFCRWNERVVLGCDDAAKSEFLNTRKAKGRLPGPGQSQSNLVFLQPDQLDAFGAVIGHGAVWINDRVEAGEPSDPMHVGGFQTANLFLSHQLDQSQTFRIEIDRTGEGQWTEQGALTVPAGSGTWHSLSCAQSEWLRIRAERAGSVTAVMELRRAEHVVVADQDLIGSLATTSAAPFRGGMLRAGDASTGLQVLSTTQYVDRRDIGDYYELTPELQLKKSADAKRKAFMTREMAVQPGILRLDGHSVLYVDDDGQRFRLPIGNPWFLEHPGLLDAQRTAREVVTERDLLQAAGTFFELPARNAGGIWKVRPITTHDRCIQDFCSWRGMLALTGTSLDTSANDPHVIVSDDGAAAVWLGSIDDLWRFGAPRGAGGPWTNSSVVAGETSDPYLLSGYQRKTLTARTSSPVTLTVEADVLGNGTWVTLGDISLSADPSKVPHRLRVSGAEADIVSDAQGTLLLPAAFDTAYWVRFRSDADSQISLLLTYE